jgi:hypothetical protein
MSGVLEVIGHPSAGDVGLAAVQLSAGVCPKPPPGLDVYTNQILGWVKWGVISILGISFFASVGMLIWGRVTHHPKGARLGFDGILICLVGAVLYVVGPPILFSIPGKGC